VETYAARRALGALMVRAATRWTAQARRPVAEAMADIERLAANGDNALCNQADMNFQHALAEASGLTRIGPMLQLLGQQVRMFIAVIGITYAFPIDPIVERNQAILAAIDEGNDELAAQRWREKIDEALNYMLEQVESLRIARRNLEPPDREPMPAALAARGTPPPEHHRHDHTAQVPDRDRAVGDQRRRARRGSAPRSDPTDVESHRSQFRTGDEALGGGHDHPLPQAQQSGRESACLRTSTCSPP
jgi:FCD domain